MSISFENSVTMYNLMRAFAGESQARNRYNMASDIARNEGYWAVAKIFDATAYQEQAHATVFYDYLAEVNFKNFDITASYPVNVVKNTADHLKYAVHNELEEYENIYKNFSDIAKSEGYDNISTVFDMIAKIENIHAQRFKNLLDDFEDDKLYQKENDQIWICTNCGHIHTGPGAPHVCPVCTKPRGYFMNKEYITIL
ncbi:MAG: rubrerythrin family protein [Clostridia bacterium]|nr:rubrerythrin family protein [Clostridia bacterium]